MAIFFRLPRCMSRWRPRVFNFLAALRRRSRRDSGGDSEVTASQHVDQLCQNRV